MIFEHLPVWAAVLVVVVTYLCLGVGIFGGFMALSIQREERQAAKDLGYIPGRQGAAR